MKTCRYDQVMNIYKFISAISFIYSSVADVEVTGELSFDIRILNINSSKGLNKTTAHFEDKGRNEEWKGTYSGGVARARHAKVTAPALLECVYRYPGRAQADALLSDMMNQLTKLFVGAQGVVEGGAPRRSPSRFRVVDKLDSSFFEKAFTNMADEYRQFYNSSLPVFNHAEDPCRHQEQVKQVWQKLLDRSQEMLRRAGQHCLEEFMLTRNRAEDSRTRLKLEQLARQELSKVRSSLLDKLCDDFQMCYNDLL